MRLTALELVNFGKFADLKVDFADGLNLVIGPNEAGKSTIQTALRTAFFGERQGLARWKRWGTENPACSIRLDYILKDGASWSLERDLAKNTVRLTQTGGGEAVVDGPTQTAKAVCDHLGLDSADAFDNTIFVRVGELDTELRQIEKSLRAKVESLLVGSAGGSITEALKALDGKYKRLAGTVSQKGAGGEVGELIAEADGLRARMAAGEAAEAELKQLAVESQSVEAALVEKEARLKVLSELVDAVKAKQAVEDRQEGLVEGRRKLRLRVDRVKADRQRRVEIESEMTGLADYQDITAADAAAVQGRLKEIRAKEMELSTATDGGREQTEAQAKPPAVFLAAAGAVVLAGVALAFSGRLALGAALAVVGAVGLTAVVVLSRPKEPIVDGRIAYIQADLARLDGEIKEVLAKVGATDVTGFVAKQAKYDSLAKALADLQNAESIMLEGAGLEELEEELAGLVDQAAVIESQLAAFTQVALSPEELFSRERELSYLGPETAELRRTRDILAGRLQSHRQLSGPPVADLRAQLAYAEERLAGTRRYAAAVELAAAEIRAIAASLSGETAPELAAKASAYMVRLTGGRYGRVDIGPELDAVVVGESGEIAPAALSTGTADQLHFAVRLAAADLISGDKRPPIILDDPFVYFDSTRLAAAREIVAELAGERQVILFSHDESFKGWPGKIIRIAAHLP